MLKYLPDFSLLRRNRPFAFLFCGQWVSFMGSMMTTVAIPYQVYQVTHSPAWVGAIGLVQLAALILCALWGGTLADKYHRKPLLLWTGSLLTLGSLCLVFNALALNSILVIFLLAASMLGVIAIDRPAREAFTQQILQKEDFARYSAINTFKNNFCMIIGPAVGGLLIAHAGLVVLYTVDLATYLFALLTLLAVPGHPNPGAERKVAFWASLKEGLQFAASRQSLMGSYSVDFFAMVFGMPMALFPAMALHTFGSSASALGWLYAAPAIGGLAFSLVSGTVSKIKRHGLAIAISAAFWGVAIILFGLSHSLWLALLFLAIAGAFDAASGLFRQTLWNETVPNTLRGRMASLEMLSYMSGPKLGDAEAGFVASIWGIPASIISGGILTIISVLACCLALPEFTGYRSTVGERDTDLEAGGA